MTQTEFIAWMEGFARSGTGLSTFAQNAILSQIRTVVKPTEPETELVCELKSLTYVLQQLQRNGIKTHTST